MFKAHRASQEQLALQAQQERLEVKAFKVLPVSREQRALQVQQEHPVVKAFKVLLALLGQLGPVGSMPTLKILATHNQR